MMRRFFPLLLGAALLVAVGVPAKAGLKGVTVNGTSPSLAALTVDSPYFQWDATHHCLNLYNGGCTNSVLQLTPTFTDPTGERNGILGNITEALTADNANDVLGIHGQLALNQGGFHSTAQHLAGLYGIGTANGATGTADYISGVVGVAANQGAGTLTTGAAFLAHTPINNGGGTFTNYYAMLDQGTCGSGAAAGITNCYGASFAFPSVIGNPNGPPTAGAMLDVRGNLTVLPGSNTTGMSMSGGTFGSADTHNLFNLSGTWNVGAGNTGGTAFLLNMVDTSSAAGTALMSLQTGGSPKFIVGKSGNTTINGQITNSGITTDATHTDATVCEDTTSHVYFFGSGAAGICLGTSSLRFKQDVGPLAVGLDQIMALRPIHYRYKPGYGDPDHELYGFAAEQVIETLPELVRADTEGRPNSVDWAGILPVVVNAIQQQQHEIATIRGRL